VQKFLSRSREAKSENICVIEISILIVQIFQSKDKEKAGTNSKHKF
jgi:hypothetical protein